MKTIVVGCGKLGSELAISLCKKGNDVAIIDSDEAAFHRLGVNFKGEKIVGVGFDREVLKRAGISKADAIIACTKSDEVNALVGRIAQTIFRVPKVISRLYDPRKAEIYHALGIQTICTTTWGVQRATDLLSYGQLDSVLAIGDSNINLVRIDIPALLVGKTVKDITAFGEFQVVAIGRNNDSFLPTLGTTFQKDDVIFIAVLSASAFKLQALLGLV